MLKNYKIFNMTTLKLKLTLVVAMLCALAANQHLTAEACSSRAVVTKPRPSTSSSSATAIPNIKLSATTTTTTTTTSTTTPRPNITFPTYKCSDEYDTWYCLNEGSCFLVKIGESVMYNCECANGFMGPRCEFKELDSSYMPKRPRPMLEKASIASGATCALLFMLFICLTLYLRYDQRTKSSKLELDDECSNSGVCCYCNDTTCCGSDDNDADATNLIAAKNRSIWSFGQHFETIPISFAIKRSAKL